MEDRRSNPNQLNEEHDSDQVSPSKERQDRFEETPGRQRSDPKGIESPETGMRDVPVPPPVIAPDPLPVDVPQTIP